MKELRSLLPSEEKFLKELVEYKESSTEGSVHKLQSGYILENNVGFNFAAIKWDETGSDSIKIYYEESNKKQEAQSSLFLLFDYLFFLEELEKAGLIAVLPAMFNEDRILYNRETYGPDKSIFDNWKENASQKGFVFWDPNRKERRIRIDIIPYLEKYVHLAIIYPKDSLVSFVKNDFKSADQVRHEATLKQNEEIHKEEMGNLRKQLSTTKISAIITAITLIATIIMGILKQCSTTKKESDELKTIAHSSQNTPSLEPTCITINLVDTAISSNNPIKVNAQNGH